MNAKKINTKQIPVVAAARQQLASSLWVGRLLADDPCFEPRNECRKFRKEITKHWARQDYFVFNTLCRLFY